MVVLTEGLVAGTEQSKAKPLEGLHLLGPSALLPLYPCFPAQPSQLSFEAEVAEMRQNADRLRPLATSGKGVAFQAYASCMWWLERNDPKVKV